MSRIYREQIEVIAKDLNSTTWSELYEAFQLSIFLKEDATITSELSRLIGDVKKMHDSIMSLSKKLPSGDPDA